MNAGRRWCLLTAAVMLGGAGCGDGKGSVPKLGSAEQVSAAAVTHLYVEGRTATVTVVCDVPTPVHTFVAATESLVTGGRTFRLFAMPGDGSFPETGYQIDARVVFRAPAAGSYRLQFLRLDGTTVDTVIVIP